MFGLFKPKPPRTVSSRCTRAPPGWCCSREAGHPGPCAARPVDVRPLSFPNRPLGQPRYTPPTRRDVATPIPPDDDDFAIPAAEPWDAGADFSAPDPTPDPTPDPGPDFSGGGGDFGGGGSSGDW